MSVTSTITCCVAKLLTVFLALLNELHPTNKSIAIIITNLIFMTIV